MVLGRDGQFLVAAESVGELHLSRGMTLRTEQFGRAHQNADATRSGRGHVQAVQAVEKFRAVGGFYGSRGSHGIDDYRSFLPLKLVDRANVGSGQPFLYFEHLGVVGSDDEHIRQFDWVLIPLVIDPAGIPIGQSADQRDHRLSLFR